MSPGSFRSPVEIGRPDTASRVVARRLATYSSHMRIIVSLLVLSALLVGCGGGQKPSSPAATSTPRRSAPAQDAAATRAAVPARDEATALDQRFVAVVARVSPAGGPIEKPRGPGSGGVVGDPRPHLTNQHRRSGNPHL